MSSFLSCFSAAIRPLYISAFPEHDFEPGAKPRHDWTAQNTYDDQSNSETPYDRETEKGHVLSTDTYFRRQGMRRSGVLPREGLEPGRQCSHPDAGVETSIQVHGPGALPAESEL